MNLETKVLQVVWGFLSRSPTCQISSLVPQLSVRLSQIIFCFILVQFHSELHHNQILETSQKIVCFSVPYPSLVFRWR